MPILHPSPAPSGSSTSIDEVLHEYFRPDGPPPRLPEWLQKANPYFHPPRPRLPRPLLRTLAAACDVAARVLRTPTLSPRANTARCYEELFDPLAAETGVWPDYTEGVYTGGDESYEEARRRQAEAVLRLCGLRPGMRVLDVGCGNGDLLDQVRRAGGVGSGITLARSQVDFCRQRGLDASHCDFDAVEQLYAPATFDIVTFIGPMEHLVTEEDARAGRQDQIIEAAFARVARLLKPGGRFFIANIHFRAPVDITRMSPDPLDHESESLLFFCSNLVRIFSGWYTTGDQIPRAAASAGLRVVVEQDATWDYLITSLHWAQRLGALLRHNPWFALRFAARLFARDPRYAFQAALLYYHESWTWQFRGGEQSPMVHIWRVLERE